MGFAFTELKRVKLVSANSERIVTPPLTMIGIFLGQFVMNRDDSQADRYVKSSGIFWSFLNSALFGTGLGLLGYLLDEIKGGLYSEYMPTKPEELAKLKKELTGEKDPTRVNIYYNMAAVFIPPNITLDYHSDNIDRINNLILSKLLGSV